MNCINGMSIVYFAIKNNNSILVGSGIERNITLTPHGKDINITIEVEHDGHMYTLQ